MNFRQYKNKLRELRKEAHDFERDPDYNPSEWGEDWCPQCQSPMYWQDGSWLCTHCGWRGPAGWNQTPEEPSEMQHPDPWMDNEPGSVKLPDHWGAVNPPDLNQADNMFGPLSGELRMRLNDFLQNPTQASWQSARSMVIRSPMMTLWKAVATLAPVMADPSVVPPVDLVMQAIRYATDSPKDDSYIKSAGSHPLDNSDDYYNQVICPTCQGTGQGEDDYSCYNCGGRGTTHGSYPNREPQYIGEYDQTTQYGGPEEGGWHYTNFNHKRSMPIPPEYLGQEDMLKEHLKQLNSGQRRQYRMGPGEYNQEGTHYTDDPEFWDRYDNQWTDYERDVWDNDVETGDTRYQLEHEPGEHHTIMLPGEHWDDSGGYLHGAANDPDYGTMPRITDPFLRLPPLSGPERQARLSGMDDPTPDPQFDQERAEMPEQHAQDQQNIVDALRSIGPEMQQFMRARGINEPDWEPLQHVIPPTHMNDWMWMGYGDKGQREYKHWATRHYLNLIPREEIPPGYEGSGMDHLLNRRYVPFATFRTRDGREVHQPVDMNWAMDHAYEDIDKLYGSNGAFGTHPYPQGYPSTEWEHMEVPPWERPPYQQQQPGPSDFDPYADLR